MRYKTLYIDPPWQYKRTGNYSAEKNYPTMSLEEIQNLPVADISEDNSILFLWTTNSFLHDAFHIIEAWGFLYKTCLTWDKGHYGLGYWLWGQTEHLLVATKGKPFRNKVPVATTIYKEMKTKHSRKPYHFYELVEKMGEEPRIELFARTLSPMFPKRDGWDVWGNEVENSIELTPTPDELGGKDEL